MTGRLRLILPALFLGGLVLGWVFPLIERDGSANIPNQDFRNRVEAFQPTCEQLRSTGLHGPVELEGGVILVQTQPDYFYVIGLHLQDGLAPMTTWWGAGRSSAISQACTSH